MLDVCAHFERAGIFKRQISCDVAVLVGYHHIVAVKLIVSDLFDRAVRRRIDVAVFRGEVKRKVSGVVFESGTPHQRRVGIVLFHFAVVARGVEF